MKKRKPTRKLAEKLADLGPPHYHEFALDSDEAGLTYQSCRFCHRGTRYLEGLWKYGVRHYICNDCAITVLAAHHMWSGWDITLLQKTPPKEGARHA